MRDGIPVHDVTVGDEVSYAVDSDHRQMWIETVSSRGSVIAKVESANDGRVSCEIVNAESPALSQDGGSLAFIREERGSGSLWLADPQDCGSQNQAVRVTPDDVDVRSVSGAPQGHFVFVGSTKQGSTVFLVSRAGNPEPLLRPGADVDSAAVSSDGQALIVSELINQQLQLVSYGLNAHTARQLTFGNCNATAPSWKDANTIIYATDCERGMGLTTLAEIDLRQ
jgi:Tol biopolymer transport system component